MRGPRVRLPVGDGWEAVYFAQRQDGWMVVSEIRIVPVPTSADQRKQQEADLDEAQTVSAQRPIRPVPDRPPTARELREMPSPEAVSRMIRNEFATGELDAHLRTLPDLTPGAASHPPRRGRGNRTPDSHYLDFAIYYDEAANDLKLRNTTQHIRQRLVDQGSRAYPLSYIRDAVSEARARGLLEPPNPGKGRVEGRLTEKAKRMREAQRAAGRTPKTTK